MKKSELKALISEIIKQQLTETSGQKIASAINNIVHEGDIKNVEIITHHGSYPVEIVEVYENNGTLYLTVNPPQN